MKTIAGILVNIMYAAFGIFYAVTATKAFVVVLAVGMAMLATSLALLTWRWHRQDVRRAAVEAITPTPPFVAPVELIRDPLPKTPMPRPSDDLGMAGEMVMPYRIRMDGVMMPAPGSATLVVDSNEMYRDETGEWQLLHRKRVTREDD